MMYEYATNECMHSRNRVTATELIQLNAKEEEI